MGMEGTRSQGVQALAATAPIHAVVWRDKIRDICKSQPLDQYSDGIRAPPSPKRSDGWREGQAYENEVTC